MDWRKQLTPEELATYTQHMLAVWNSDVFPSVEAREIKHFPEWAADHFRLSKSTGGTGKFIPFPYQVGIMHMMAMPELEKLALFKCAQIGYTQMLLAWYFYETTHRNRSTILYQPTDSDAVDFSTSAVDEVLSIAPEIAAELSVVIDGGAADKKDSGNTTHKKVYKNAIGYILGAKSPNAFRRRTAPSVGMDEVDSMDHNVGDEGRPDKLADSRSAGVNAAIKQICGSTPTISGSSLIELIASEIRVQLRRYYPCPECDHYQWLCFGGRDEAFGIKWDGSLATNEEKAKSCYYQCQGCSHHIQYEDMPEMDEKAQWRDPEEGIYFCEKEICFKSLQTHAIVDTPLYAVLHLNSLMSYTKVWWRTTLQFLNAVDQQRAGDHTAMINFLNHSLGECFIDKGEKKIKLSVLMERTKKENYSANALPSEVEHITIGCDVQGDRIEYGIYGWGYGEEAWCIEYHRVQGNPATTNVFESLRIDSDRKFTTVDGRTLGVELVCVDSGHLAQTVYDFCSHDPQRFIPIKGSNQLGDPDVVWPKQHTEGTYRVRLGTQAIKDTIATRLTFEEVGPGYQHWPSLPEFDERYFRELTAESRKLRRLQGKPVRMWECPNGRRNEPWDVHVYALAAIRILQRYYRKTFTAPTVEQTATRLAAALGGEVETTQDRVPVQHYNLQKTINPNKASLEDILNRMAS